MVADNLITLDPQIRDWVLIPIFLVMIAQGIIRHYASIAFQTDPRPLALPVLHQQVMNRSRRLRMNASYIPASSFRLRKHYLSTSDRALAATAETRQARREEYEVEDGVNAADPMGMMGGMKQQLSMILPNMLQMGWVSYFFSGFVALKLPFPLTDRFKAMVQRGVPLRSLDNSYVSALSWFFLSMFGSRSLFSIILGSTENVGGEEQMMMSMGGMGMGMGGMGPQIEFDKNYKEEKTELELVRHIYAPQQAEYTLLGLPVPASMN